MAKETKAMVKPAAPQVPAVPQEPEDWEKALSAKAKDTRSALTVGVPRIGHSAAGMEIGGKLLADRVVRVVVLGVVWVKAWYEKAWEKGSHDTPGCYAFGLREQGMVPHEAAPKKQAATCGECQHNKFGTALLGKGKRCGDRPTMLVLLADDLAKQGDTEVNRAIEKAERYQISVPPVSIKLLGQYAASLADLTTHGDLSEAITEIGTEGMQGGGYKLKFNFLGPVPRAAMPAIVKRSADAFEVIAKPFPVIEQGEPEAPAKPIKGQSAAPKGRR